MLGAMFGIGFILGPVMGGLLGGIDLHLPFFVAGGTGAGQPGLRLLRAARIAGPAQRRPVRLVARQPAVVVASNWWR
jgi:DHA1 family tetracycline resistance protein-like MFS transporter